MGLRIWPPCSLVNSVGLAWWARIETSYPIVTYWYGPFINRRSLERTLPIFLSDISNESPGTVTQAILRTYREEPFTIEAGIN
uniref:DUF1816 domain-containing protein n=1 Tax=Paulinella chromatophora TaxID=39717 RepID=B1X412_PAUCH|nr:hypothetical protein PCC_0232 [Paulinella chromatophora]ACB42681.1 hypothetical protein PCC_0232 [Paulinella chromatophora]